MAFNFEHVLEWRRFEETYLMTLHSSSATVGPSDAHTAWGLAVAELWGPGTGGNPGVRSIMSTRIQSSRYTTYLLDAPLGRKISKFETTLVTAGTDASNEMIPAVALVVQLLSVGTTGRHNGRIYLPAPAFDQWDQGFLKDPPVTQALNSTKAALLKLYAANVQPAVVDQRTGQHNQITDVAALNRAYFLRSRDKSFHYGRTITHVFP
jgi:hypothetical protein